MRNLNEVKVWTAIVTPLTDGGELDLVSFEGLLRKQEKAGNGVVVAGSTGEGLALSTQQKQILVQTVTRLRLQIPVIAGVGGFALEECKNWIRWCESEGVDGFLLVTPVYAKPGAEGQSAWFQSLMDASSLPCMIYNVPGRSAVKLHPEALRRISQHENFWAVKESSGSIAEFLQYRALAPHARFYCGDDALMPFFASAGAVGLDRKSTRLNSSHSQQSRMPSSA